MAVNKPKLRHTLRQIAVRMNAALISEHSTGTIHRLYRKILIVYDSRIHIILVMIPMSRA